MRKIKFRGKTGTTEGKKWVYGNYYKVKSFFNDNIGHFIGMIKNNHLTDFTIEENTLGQYTGLKDKNGVEIYEGDIVNMHYFYENYDSSLGVYEDETEVIGIIKINEYGVYLETKSNEIYYLANYVQEPTEELEVIGNIYDNPELLKESEY